jgi:hypothetical protein
MGVDSFLRGMVGLVASSVVLIVLALVYFMVTAWIVSFGVETVLGSPPSADFVALSAALLSLGSLAGSSYTIGGSGDVGQPMEDRRGASEVA